MYRTIYAGRLYSFFDWLLRQKRGKGGRRRRGTKHKSSLGTYWKLYRLVYEKTTGEKLNGQINRVMHRVGTPQTALDDIDPNRCSLLGTPETRKKAPPEGRRSRKAMHVR